MRFADAEVTGLLAIALGESVVQLRRIHEIKPEDELAAAMPHMEKLHQKLGSQGLVVLGVCVWEERAKFDAWQKKPEVKTNYLKVFDPAGRNTAASIAKKLYSVSGIPTFYLIDKDGKVAFAGVGSGPKTEGALDQALAAAGFKL